MSGRERGAGRDPSWGGCTSQMLRVVLVGPGRPVGCSVKNVGVRSLQESVRGQLIGGGMGSHLGIQAEGIPVTQKTAIISLLLFSITASVYGIAPPFQAMGQVSYIVILGGMEAQRG